MQKFIYPQSLARTLDAVEEAFAAGTPPAAKARAEIAAFLAGRQGLPGSYAGMFAPTERDFADGIKLYTGEKITTYAGTSHILGEETCRMLRRLKPKQAAVKDALSRANDNMLGRLSEYETPQRPMGMYCCGACSVAYWRNLVAGGLNKQTQRLKEGLISLRAHRDHKGGWRRFPFYYTLLGLIEMNPQMAKAELAYVKPLCEKRLGRLMGEEPYRRRRRFLLQRVPGIKSL